MLKSPVLLFQLLGSIRHRLHCTLQHQLLLFTQSGSPSLTSPRTMCIIHSRIPFNSILSYKTFCSACTCQSKRYSGRGSSAFSFRKEKCKYCDEGENGEASSLLHYQRT
uniref:Uncharacterized protein n=1 Tax=Rhipicephalus microplus TaxID=6941 RepID=A0A6G5A2R4_RHIMP